MDKPTVYLIQDEAYGVAILSSESPDNPEFDTNNIELCELRNGKKVPTPITVNIIRNILTKAGVHVVVE